MPSSLTMSQIRRVTVFGAGLMGGGIAQVCVQHGFDTVLVDVSYEVLQSAISNMRARLHRAAKRQYTDDSRADHMVKDIMSRLTVQTNPAEAVKNADLVIEAVTEKLDVKQNLFKLLDGAAPSHCIFTSNTSSLLISEIMAKVNRKDRCGGLHFFLPVPMMELLEVVRTADASETTFRTLLEFATKIGKTALPCKDTPLFVVNAILNPIGAHALRLVEAGIATPQDIDKGMKLGAGHVMGPFEMQDFVGLDLLKLIMDGLHKRYPNDPLFKPSAVLNKMVAEGKYGRKTGEGWYKYNKGTSKL